MIKTLTKIAFLHLVMLFPLLSLGKTVVISEIGFRSPAGNEDFVELYNSTGSAINLNGYKLIPSSGSTITFSSSEVIPANGYLVISKNSSSASFQSSWGVTFGANVIFLNSAGSLSNSAGVTFILRNSSGTPLDFTIYPVTLGSRQYQCPVGSFYGNNLETDISYCSPGSVNSLSVDDLTHWTISRNNNVWDVGSVSSSTGSDNLIVKRLDWFPNSTDQINDVYLADLSYLQSVNTNFTISGNLIIGTEGSVNVTGTGSINVSGTITQKRVGVNTNTKYNVWSSPFSSTLNILSSYSGANPCDLYTYNATTQEWKYDYSVPFSTTCNGNSVTITSANTMTDGTSDGNFDIGRGYFVPGSSSNTERTLIGTSFNNGNLSVPIYGSSVAIAGGNDWNLIGNPYPSGLDVALFLSDANNATLINAVYLYVGDAGGYTTLNSSSTYYLASCQGFFVNAVSSTDGLLGNLNFSNSMRNRANYLWRNSNPTAFISLNDDSYSDQIQIIIDANSDDHLDNKHDAYKLLNPNNLNLASYIDTELFVFNGIKPITENQTKTLKLHVQTPDAGVYTIDLDSISLIDSNIDFVLEDKSNSSFTNLKDGNYSFSTTQSETFNNRFFLHLTNNVTSVSELTNELNVSIYTTDGFVNVNALGKTNIDKIEIYDVLGKMIYVSNKSNNIHVINVEGYQSGVYFVKAYGENGKLSTKRIYISN